MSDKEFKICIYCKEKRLRNYFYNDKSKPDGNKPSIVISCCKCNRSKGTKTDIEYLKGVIYQMV